MPKKPTVKAVAETIKAQRAEQQVYRESLGGDMRDAVMAIPGMSEIFVTDDQKRMLTAQLTTLVESAISMQFDMEAMQAQADASESE